MNDSIWPHKALNASAVFWFTLAMIGQLIFVTYIVKTFYVSAVQADWNIWNTHLTHGFEPGKTSSNVASLSHMLLAALVIISGFLQLMPKIRNTFPKFHRINGRLYISLAVIMSLSGLFLMWTTGTVGDWTMRVGLSLSGLLIFFFAYQTYRHARARRIVIHRRWAIRLFLVVSTVWFFRVGLMLWFFINQGPAGMDPKTFTGPFITFLAFAQWVIPLLVAELYFRAQTSQSKQFKIIMASVLFILTLMMAVGIFMATLGMWFPAAAG